MFKKIFKCKEYLFDDEDYELVKMNNWIPDQQGYLRATINGNSGFKWK